MEMRNLMQRKRHKQKQINKKDPFIDIYPSLDLHGEVTSMISFIINDFIQDNIKLGNKCIVIIHGIGTGKIKNKTHEILKENKNVIEYHVDNYNLGVTIVKLSVDK